VRLIVNQVVNDFLDLLGELKRGDGRPAIRTSRSIIEHAINLRTVAEDLPTAQRYLDHLDQIGVLVSRLDLSPLAFDGKDRRAEKHRLKKLGRDAERRFAEAEALHGRTFARQWHPKSVRDRADGFGWAEAYDLYRLASLVTHGSAGGALGSTRQRARGDLITYRPVGNIGAESPAKDAAAAVAGRGG